MVTHRRIRFVAVVIGVGMIVIGFADIAHRRKLIAESKWHIIVGNI